MAAHFNHKDRRRQNGGNRQVAAQGRHLDRFVIFFLFSRTVQLRGIPCISRRFGHGLRSCGTGKEFHNRRLGRQIDRYVSHCRGGGQRLFHPRHAGPATHVADIQRYLILNGRVSCGRKGLCDRCGCRGAVKTDRCRFRSKVHRHVAHAIDGAQRFFCPCDA